MRNSAHPGDVVRGPWLGSQTEATHRHRHKACLTDGPSDWHLDTCPPTLTQSGRLSNPSGLQPSATSLPERSTVGKYELNPHGIQITQCSIVV